MRAYADVCECICRHTRVHVMHMWAYQGMCEAYEGMHEAYEGACECI